MYVSHDRQAVFLAQPRTASRAVGQVMREQYGATRVGGHHNIQVDQLDKWKAEGYKVLTAVRNHWDIIVSWYHWESGPGQQGAAPMESFESFLVRFPTTEKNGYITTDRLFWRYHGHATHILRYEDLWPGLGRVMGEPVDMAHVPTVGASVRHPYRAYYSAHTRDLVLQWYGEEIRHYGYSF